MGDEENSCSQSEEDAPNSQDPAPDQSDSGQSQIPPPAAPPKDYPICRLPHDSDKLSGVLGEKLLGYISVQVKFLGIPVKDLKLTIENADHTSQIPDKKWAAKRHWKANDPNMTTDGDGRCTLGKRVPIGLYTCKIEHQPEAAITTVEDVGRPFILELPIGRPYNDLYIPPQD